jgi:hypothetical protein
MLCQSTGNDAGTSPLKMTPFTLPLKKLGIAPEHLDGRELVFYLHDPVAAVADVLRACKPEDLALRFEEKRVDGKRY